MPVTATTTLKLPRELKVRVSRVARKTGRSAHAFMIEAIERHTAYEERMEAFVKEALAADRAADATGEVYAASDVHAWLSRVAEGRPAPRPKPWHR